MKNLLIVFLALTSVSAFAKDSIILNMPDATGLGIDTYTIPSKDGESAEQSLIVLVNARFRDVCYTGNVSKVKVILDATVSSAKNVKEYSSFISKKSLSVGLTVYNKTMQRNEGSEVVIHKCKF